MRELGPLSLRQAAALVASMRKMIMLNSRVRDQFAAAATP
jgi:hypothetical protein